MLMIGCDPEFFVKKNGRFVSGETYTTGTKRKPVNISVQEYRYVGFQRDNVAVEFSCDPAALTPFDSHRVGQGWISILTNAMQSIFNILPADIELVCEPSAFFPEEELQTRTAQEFGCDPDFNAYTGEVNEKPASAMNATFRSCGGHIHLGYTDAAHDISRHEFLMNVEGHKYITQVMDIFLGIPSTILDGSQAAIDRRQLYGEPGCFRSTRYGVEYRTLSNYWMKSPLLASLILHLSHCAVQATQRVQLLYLQKELGGADKIIEVISTGDTKEAKKMFKDILQPRFMGITRTLWEKCQKYVQGTHNLKKEWNVT